MSREIKFRGKKIDNGEWIYGVVVFKAFNGTPKVINVGIQKAGYFPVEVHPDSVGQFTGLHDKNGREIYEGDIISKKRKKDMNNFASELWHDPNYYSVVLFFDGCFSADGFLTLIDYIKDYQGNIQAEVIGNIYENQELLK